MVTFRAYWYGVKILASSNHTSTGFSLVRMISDKVVDICNYFCEVSSLTIGKLEIICEIITGLQNKTTYRDIRQLNTLVDAVAILSSCQRIVLRAKRPGSA